MGEKETIAFFVMRYGEGINGGAEYHCKMLAERLVPYYNVEVLTTCVKNYITGENEYCSGNEELNDVLIRRFLTNPVEREREWEYAKEAKRALKLRRLLYKLRLLKPLSYLCPVWTYKTEMELKRMKCNVFYSTELFSYVKEHKNQYKAILTFSSDFPFLYYAALYAPERTIAIPTMHYTYDSFRSIQTFIFSKVAYIGFNTTAEQKLAKNLIGHPIAPNGIISVGIETPEAADWGEVKRKYHLPDKYLLYVGRVDSGKLYRIIEYFLEYKKKYANSELKFVLVGGLFMKKVDHSDIIYTGFVSDNEKISIIQNATLVINPSHFESLSLILLEALYYKKAMLVYGGCAVLKEHCKKSGNAALYYCKKRGFISQLHKLECSDRLRFEMGEKGRRYVEENYRWEVILGRLRDVIEKYGAAKGSQGD